MKTDPGRNEDSAPPAVEKSGLKSWQVIGSVLAAAFGVQSSRNRERDFREGRFTTFIVAGVLLTALFVATLYLVVSTVLEHAR